MEKNKADYQKQILAIIQRPTLEAIREQVSEELDEQLSGQVSDLDIESALKKTQSQ